MAGISRKKTKNGIKYTITYRDIFGKQHTSGLYDTIREAKEKLSIFNKHNLQNKNITIGEIFSLYFQRAEQNYAENTLINYKMYYARYFKKFENVKYIKFSSLAAQELISEIEKDSSYVALICFKFSKSAFNYAKKHDLIDNNYFEKVERPKLPIANINHLDQSQLIQVLQTCKKNYPRYYALLFTLIGTGLRIGELLALEKEDLNLVGRYIQIDKQYTNGKLKLKTKTDKSNRKVYLFNSLIDVLEEHIKTIPDEVKLLFPNSKGKYLHLPNLRRRVWEPLLKDCGITYRVRIHDLRGSFTDLSLAEGLSIKFTQNQLGHAKSETTLNVYARNNIDMVNRATERIGNVFARKCENFVRMPKNEAKNKIIQFPQNRRSI